MPKRPIAVTVVSLLFIAAGVVGITYHMGEFDLRHPLRDYALLILLVRALAIVAGTFMLLARNWARWLALAWMAFHVVLSAFDSWQQCVMHGLILAMIGYALFRPEAKRYFSRVTAQTA